MREPRAFSTPAGRRRNSVRHRRSCRGAALRNPAPSTRSLPNSDHFAAESSPCSASKAQRTVGDQRHQQARRRGRFLRVSLPSARAADSLLRAAPVPAGSENLPADANAVSGYLQAREVDSVQRADERRNLTGHRDPRSRAALAHRLLAAPGRADPLLHSAPKHLKPATILAASGRSLYPTNDRSSCRACRRPVDHVAVDLWAPLVVMLVSGSDRIAPWTRRGLRGDTERANASSPSGAVSPAEPFGFVSAPIKACR